MSSELRLLDRSEDMAPGVIVARPLSRIVLTSFELVKSNGATADAHPTGSAYFQNLDAARSSSCPRGNVSVRVLQHASSMSQLHIHRSSPATSAFVPAQDASGTVSKLDADVLPR